MAESKVSALEGNELADDYVRTEVPQSRWGDTWEVFKNNFTKIVIINVLTLLFFVPGIAVILFRLSFLTQWGVLYPLSSNAVFSYPFYPNTQGMAETVTLSAGVLFYSLLLVAAMIAAVGIAGASYSIKKLINTHGQFTLKGYFHGVRICYLNTVFPTLMFMAFFVSTLIISDWAAQQIANGHAAGGPITAKVFIIIATVLVGIYSAWLLAVGVSYKINFKYLIKNSFVLCISTIIQTVFMIGFSLIPVWLLWIFLNTGITLLITLIAVVFLFMGVSFTLLCWFAYTQWVFDSFVTPTIKSEKEAKRAQMTPKQLEAEKEEEEKAMARELLAAGRSELIGRPLRPIADGDRVEDIGIAFDRNDIARAAQDRQNLENGVNEYYEQHKSDTRYVEYERMFAEREKALQAPKGKKGKGKKVSSANLLNQ